MAKMFEDSICSLGVIESDAPKHVKTSILTVINQGEEDKKKGFSKRRSKIDKENGDYVEIIINSLIE